MKKIFFSLIAVCLLGVALPVAAQAAELTYALSDGKLLYYNEDGVITGCDKDINYAIIPSQIDGIEITAIGNRAFDGCKVLVSAILPENITSIGDNAFDGCIYLQSIYYRGSESMWEEINKNNNSFENIPIYYQCEAIEPPPALTYTLPDGNLLYYDIIGNIRGCDDSITDLVIPGEIDSIAITAIGGFAFSGCGNLTSIIIPEGVTSIEPCAFRDCVGLNSIVIPESVTRIGDGAFYGCSSLTSIEIPKSVASINSYAFADCPLLKDIYYAGSESQWREISIEPFDLSDDITIHYAKMDAPDDSQPGKLPIETEPGSLGQEITVYVMGGYWITAQVRNGTAVAISAIQAPETGNGEMTAVNFSAPKGSTIQIWVTEEKMTFTDGGAPNCKILYAVSTTL